MKKFTKVLMSVLTVSAVVGTTVFAAPASVDSIETKERNTGGSQFFTVRFDKNDGEAGQTGSGYDYKRRGNPSGK